ncbi:TetR/AcrR family transcriptional regulator [Sphingobacterium bovistauri]|uniref:TetR/AcrR family transcriptional regulator n=1 Tax=Sphingobacterium bovistauri TaxID=2781959 RepID=A0ABS7ZBN9_9SPHI|nr:TetR/AcrR family transcriptional regulator [Sphingobacterium bovistauri]MCA5006339.1 TetR/AcrR family transcriptional regulator [Sphingobacterium bovistauri]
MNVQFTDKIDNIFKSTLHLIKDNGFHGTPMSQIAKHADVAIGTIYHYFPSKDELILALFEYCRKELYAHIFQHVNQEMDYKEQFYSVFKSFCTFHIHQREYSCFFEQFYNSPYNEIIRQKEFLEGPYGQNTFMKFILRGIQENHFKPLDEKIICSAYIGAAISYAKTVVYGKIDFSEKELTDLIDIIWTGIKNND